MSCIAQLLDCARSGRIFGCADLAQANSIGEARVLPPLHTPKKRIS
jgi:hypothetical protein